MSDLKNMEKAIADLEATALSIEQAVDGAQELANDLWKQNLRPEVARKELQAIRNAALEANGEVIGGIQSVAGELVGDIESRWTTEAIARREPVVGGPRSDTDAILGRAALRQEIAYMTDADLEAYAQDYARDGNFAGMRMIQSEAHRRDNPKLRTAVLNQRAKMGEHPKALAAQELADRARLVADRAKFAAEKFSTLEGGDGAAPKVSEEERLKKTALRVRETLADAGKRIAGSFA